jgi:hypothetical protein
LLVSAATIAGCAPSKPALPASQRQRVPGAERTHAVGSLPASLDGLVFIRDGRLYRVTAGVAAEIAEDGRRKLAVASADGAGLVVTEEDGDGSDVVLASSAHVQPEKTLLHVDEASTLLSARFARSSGQLFRAMQGDPSATLFASSIRKPSAVTTLALASDGDFSGEFDVNGPADTLVYTSATQNPASLFSIGGSGRRLTLVSDLATIFAPAVARSGSLVCFTGQKHAGDPMALWVLGIGDGPPRRLASTSGLVPTHPVLSEDGSWVAFRGGEDSALYLVRPDGTQLRKLPFVSDDAPLAW